MYAEELSKEPCLSSFSLNASDVLTVEERNWNWNLSIVPIMLLWFNTNNNIGIDATSIWTYPPTLNVIHLADFTKELLFYWFTILLLSYCLNSGILVRNCPCVAHFIMFVTWVTLSFVFDAYTELGSQNKQQPALNEEPLYKVCL